jgi:hypothetical protein
MHGHACTRGGGTVRLSLSLPLDRPFMGMAFVAISVHSPMMRRCLSVLSAASCLSVVLYIYIYGEFFLHVRVSTRTSLRVRQKSTREDTVHAWRI